MFFYCYYFFFQWFIFLFTKKYHMWKLMVALKKNSEMDVSCWSITNHGFDVAMYSNFRSKSIYTVQHSKEIEHKRTKSIENIGNWKIEPSMQKCQEHDIFPPQMIRIKNWGKLSISSFSVVFRIVVQCDAWHV